jgi:hypothetical protein
VNVVRNNSAKGKTMNWIKKKNVIKPPKGRPLLCYCPDWNDSGYQVAFWNGDRFWYNEEPNEYFDDEVIEWTLFLEAE